MRLDYSALKAVLAAFVLGAACPAYAADAVKIGVGIAQTGPFSPGAVPALDAYKMWADDLNAKGGLGFGRGRLVGRFLADRTVLLKGRCLDLGRGLTRLLGECHLGYLGGLGVVDCVDRRGLGQVGRWFGNGWCDRR